MKLLFTINQKQLQETYHCKPNSIITWDLLADKGFFLAEEHCYTVHNTKEGKEIIDLYVRGYK